MIALLVVPALGQTKAQYDRYLKEFKAKMAKDLQLSPDQEKAMTAVEKKFAAERQVIVASLRKAGADLETALKAPTPDEAKIKGLVNEVLSGQDKLFATFKNERDEKLACPEYSAARKVSAGDQGLAPGDVGKAGSETRGEEIIEFRLSFRTVAITWASVAGMETPGSGLPIMAS